MHSSICYHISLADAIPALIEPMLNQITVGKQVSRIEPRVMNVLLCLIKQQGQVVSREALLEEAWPAGYTSDESLTKAVSHLRKALKDTSKSNRVIETIPKKGYRLTVLAQAIDAQPELAPELTISANKKSMRPLPINLNQISWVSAISLVLILLMVNQSQPITADPSLPDLSHLANNFEDPSISKKPSKRRIFKSADGSSLFTQSLESIISSFSDSLAVDGMLGPVKPGKIKLLKCPKPVDLQDAAPELPQTNATGLCTEVVMTIGATPSPIDGL